MRHLTRLQRAALLCGTQSDVQVLTSLSSPATHLLVILLFVVNGAYMAALNAMDPRSLVLQYVSRMDSGLLIPSRAIFICMWYMH